MTTHFELYSVGPTVRWRLLAANNRDSGQSALGYADADACRAGLASLLDMIGELQPHFARTAGQRWQWQLALGDQALARSSRSFDRRPRCEAACEWFIRMAPVAAIGTTLRVVLARIPGDVASAFAARSLQLQSSEIGNGR
jgi:hypothetical protein